MCDNHPRLLALLRRGGVREEDMVRRPIEDESPGAPIRAVAGPLAGHGHARSRFALSDPCGRCAGLPAAVAACSATPRAANTVNGNRPRACTVRWSCCSLATSAPTSAARWPPASTPSSGRPNPGRRWPAPSGKTCPTHRCCCADRRRKQSVLEEIRVAAGNDPRMHNLGSELPIPRLLALIEDAHSMVSVDTGPAHAAAALGLPAGGDVRPGLAAQMASAGSGQGHGAAWRTGRRERGARPRRRRR